MLMFNVEKCVRFGAVAVAHDAVLYDFWFGNVDAG